MRNLKWVILALVVIGLWACKKEAQEFHPQEGRTFSARVYTLSPEKVTLYRELPATVEARRRARLSSKVAGFVREVKVSEGDRVNRGEVLLRLDDRDIRQRLRALSAAAQALRKEWQEVSAREAFARAEYERFRKLFEAEAATAEEFEARKSEYEALSARKAAVAARIEEIEARLAEVKTLLAYTVIRAPFEGRVVRKLVDTGTYVGPGQPLLELESEPEGKRLVCHPEETLFGRIKPGKSVLVWIPSAEKALELTVSEVVPEVDPGSRTFTVKIDLPRDFPWPSGTYARVFLPAGEREILVVPSAALVDRGGFRAVFVVDQEGLVQLRVVRTGKTFWRSAKGLAPVCVARPCEAYVEILSGVVAGERVMVSPPAGLREGDRVKGD